LYLFLSIELVTFKNGHGFACPKMKNEKKFLKKGTFYDLLTQLVRIHFHFIYFSHVKKMTKNGQNWSKIGHTFFISVFCLSFGQKLDRIICDVIITVIYLYKTQMLPVYDYGSFHP
jgi:hypothetical protein